MSEYIIPFYDVLHTLGEEYPVEDVNLLAERRGLRYEALSWFKCCRARASG